MEAMEAYIHVSPLAHKYIKVNIWKYGIYEIYGSSGSF
jgi:hypothetical protein